MATYTIQVSNVCSGGEHIGLTINRAGVLFRKMDMTKTDILANNTTFEEMLGALIKEIIKASGATTMVQAKTAIEAARLVM